MTLSGWARLWIVARVTCWVVGLGACLLGLYYVLQSFRLMFDHRPTGASLTLGMGVMVLLPGLAIFGAGFLFRGKRRTSAK